jgi:hypothetical protein
MSTMDERKFREMYDTQCEVIDAIAEALHVSGEPNDVVAAAAQEMKLRAFRAEAERDSAKRLVEIARDYYDRELRELREALTRERSRLMTVTSERDTLRRSEDAERAYRERQNAQTLAEVKALGAKLRGES